MAHQSMGYSTPKICYKIIPQVWLMVLNPTPRAYLRALTEDNKRKNLQKSNGKSNFCNPGGE